MLEFCKKKAGTSVLMEAMPSADGLLIWGNMSVLRQGPYLGIYEELLSWSWSADATNSSGSAWAQDV